MKVYVIEYIVGNTKEKRNVEAKNLDELFEFCQRNNYILHSYKEENIFVKIKNKIFSGSKDIKKTLNDKDSYRIIKALYILNYAQIPPSRRLAYMLQSVKTKRLLPLVRKWDEYMTEGAEVSEALNKIGMSEYIVYSVRVGSISGEVTESYKKIMQVLENKLDTRKKVRSLLTSPMISFTLLYAMFLFYMFFYYQQIQDILKYMDQSKFPTITIKFLAWSNYATSSALHGFLFVVMSATIFLSTIYFSAMLIKKALPYIPGLKNILRYQDYIVFFSLLNIALSSNISIFKSIRLSAEAIGNYKLRLALISSAEKIESGGVSFSEVSTKEKIFNGDFESEAAIANFEETTDTKHFELLISMQQEKLNDVIRGLSAFIQPILMLVIVAAIIVFQYAANAPMWTFGKGV